MFVNTRMRDTDLNNVGIFPGNNKEIDYCETSNLFSVTPPLGKDVRHITGYIISGCCILPLAIYGAYRLAKKMKSKKNNPEEKPKE